MTRGLRDPIVSIIIVNYNGGPYLSACLDSVLHQSYAKIETIVIENQSVDGSYEQALRNHDSRVRILRNDSNLGYPGALNKGSEMSKGEYLLFLNNDAALHSRAVEELVKAASSNPRFDFFQPKILLAERPSAINSTGMSIHYCGFGTLRDGGKNASQCNSMTEISAVHGACFMCRAKAFRDAGKFDHHFFSYYEDTDLSWRVLLRGGQLIYVPSARVYHQWGQAWGSISSAKIRLAERNRLIIVLTNYDLGTLVILSPLLFFTEIAMLAWASRHAMVRAKITAYADLVILRRHLHRRRDVIKRIRRRSDAWILKTRFTAELSQVRLGGPWLSPIRSMVRIFESVVIDRL